MPDSSFEAYRLLWCFQALASAAIGGRYDATGLAHASLIAVVAATPSRPLWAAAAAVRVGATVSKVPAVWDSMYWQLMTDAALLWCLATSQPFSRLQATVRAQMAVFYAASAFWKLNTSFLDPRTSWRSVFAAARGASPRRRRLGRRRRARGDAGPPRRHLRDAANNVATFALSVAPSSPSSRRASTPRSCGRRRPRPRLRPSRCCAGATGPPRPALGVRAYVALLGPILRPAAARRRRARAAELVCRRRARHAVDAAPRRLELGRRTCTLNLRSHGGGGNHLLLPTGLLPDFFRDAAGSVFFGGEVVEATTPAERATPPRRPHVDARAARRRRPAGRRGRADAVLQRREAAGPGLRRRRARGPRLRFAAPGAEAAPSPTPRTGAFELTYARGDRRVAVSFDRGGAVARCRVAERGRRGTARTTRSRCCRRRRAQASHLPRPVLDGDGGEVACLALACSRSALPGARRSSALEDDSTAVETLKRDVADFQHLELETSRRYLVSLQKTYDKLRSEADAREGQQKAYQEELVTLDRLCTEARTKQTHPNQAVAQLKHEIEREEKDVKDALVQKDVFTHMIKRLSDDMLAVRQSGFGIKEQLATVEREIAACTLQLQSAKQESKHEEVKLAKLEKQVKSRRKMQEARLAGIQKVIAERSSLVEKQEERMRMREAVYSSMLEKKITAEEESLGALETTFQKIKIVTGLSDVDEIVQKFKDRTHKTHQLHQLAEDAIAGNREIYQEMDTFNKGLGKALRQCEEAKDRKVRSKVTLEQLARRRALRSKIEGKFFPTPSNEQLPEYLRELDSKLTVKMKAVSEALALEDTNGSSEKLQKMLYHKLMLTNPDQGPRNVRVRARPCLQDLERYTQRKLMTGGLEDRFDLEDDVSEFAYPTQGGGGGGGAPPAAGGEDEGLEGVAAASKEDELREPVVDRDTVKRLSNLIITRENPKKGGGKKKRDE
ncbi:hypothetical protein JL721_7168 [Aureococcus anophagefferens]|nr:hypothetical protein JL721_7168 [Aureococcus anophagefferens]